MALIDKSTDDIDQQRKKSVPMIFASELKAHRETPAVRARLARVSALVDARSQARGGDTSSPA